MIKFKSINKKNIKAALKIYNYYVIHSTATFHLQKIDEKEMLNMLYIDHPLYPSYLIYDDESISGFCYLSPFRKKEAYDISAEITLYLDHKFIGKGIGKSTLLHLENEAKKNGIKNLVAVITEENKSSIHLFQKNGYFKVGHLKKIGVKFGKNLDVLSFQKEI